MIEHEHTWALAGCINTLGEWWGTSSAGPRITLSRCLCGAWKQKTVWAILRGLIIHEQTEIRLPAARKET